MIDPMDAGKLSTVALIALLGAMSPGPDFAVVTRNCLSGSFRNGLFCALGVASALLIHLSYCLLGIALIIVESPPIFYALKYLGAAYLFYLGVLLLKEKKAGPEGHATPAQMHKGRQSFVAGFLCNLLNPKCTLFMLSFFTQFVDPGMNLLDKAILGGVVLIVSLGWFVLLSYLITHRLFRKHFARFQIVISKSMGVVLCLLALFVVL